MQRRLEKKVGWLWDGEAFLPGRRHALFIMIGLMLLGGLVAARGIRTAQAKRLEGMMVDFFARHEIHNVLNFDQRAVEYIYGPADWREDLRRWEELAYWEFGPIDMQLHFYDGRVSRIGFFAAEETVRKAIYDQIVEVFGEEKEWTLLREYSKMGYTTVVVNRSQGISLCESDQAVFVYAYVLR